jgi:hypothetical protein
MLLFVLWYVLPLSVWLAVHILSTCRFEKAVGALSLRKVVYLISSVIKKLSIFKLVMVHILIF